MISGGLDQIFEWPRPVKRAILTVVDALFIAASFLAAMTLRLDSLHWMDAPQIWMALAVTLPVTLLLFDRFGIYRTVVRFIGVDSLKALGLGVILSALFVFTASHFFELLVPRSVPFIYALLLFITAGGTRFAVRSLFLQRRSLQKSRVIIYGAGMCGRQVLVSLQQASDYLPVAFVDDAPELHGAHIGGLEVFPPQAIPQLMASTGAKIVLLAIPSATLAQRKRIIAQMEDLPVRVQTIPDMTDIVSGRANVSEIRQVAPEDMLGRDPVPPDPALMGANITGKVVLVTGAGGSIGSELCRQILRQKPSQLALLEQSEIALYMIERELDAMASKEGIDVVITPLLGSVQHEGRIGTVLSRLGVNTIFHAAAYKHVNLVEENVVEGLRNNTFGTLTMARAAIQAGVNMFVLVSTDKAVRPTNIMGASKRMAELVCQSLASEQLNTRFCMVRFGNVLESSGSVVPLFRRQIAAGGPVTVTHPEVTRYFMTIPEASQLVIQASALARGGDVFVLDMGEPVKVYDLARRIIRLSGLKPYVAGERGAEAGDIEIVFGKLGPAEKLHEELLVSDHARPTRHPRILTEPVTSMAWSELEPVLHRLRDACDAYDITNIRNILVSAPAEYTPAPRIADLMWRLTARNAAAE
ncbi:polysaccharide biosynthesis protein [Glycocaulis alkaliphilus]|uniref:Polysaccharide biosynthesis protein n=1 Tax=Glycocaulis alkaliphilus TaxID=1434191 RepID=A0A3T0EBH7_9PROT|nr:nucleoside-diphosphate sugar epimerase/dehydratase [Glycocaulis alkaliphilus]AZU04672.1 polysaccharide biosynthesis protein [Glycocaulis alkaliphilus]GGB68649.1 nucleoside-diphosphate sugar epimerase [Glycocaulis alkaliphilus]